MNSTPLPGRDSPAASAVAPDRQNATVPAAVNLRVPATTVLKIGACLLLLWALWKLLSTFVLVVFSLLIAVALAPCVARLERRGLSRGLAVTVVAAMMIGVIALFVFVVVPPLATQTMDLVTHLRGYRHNVEARLETDYPILAKVVDQIFDLPSSPEVAKSFKRPLVWGRLAVEATVGAVLCLVMAFYWMIDGKRTYAWLLAYVPRSHRKKMALTMPAVSEVVMAYVQGQVLTSVLYGAYALAVLTILRVPAAIPLAVLAAVCDVLPILGVVLSTVPAVFFALTVSPLAAGAVLALYLLYHALENYLIIPRVYGQRLRLSTLVVLIALLVGASLYGVVGAVLILPVVAAYPIIERIWLNDYLSDEVMADHQELAKASEEGSDQAVDAVIRGVEHEAEVEDPSAAREARRLAEADPSTDSVREDEPAP